MTRLSLSLVGPFRITLDNAPVTDFATDKVRALLAYLAVEANHPHRRDVLAGLLWPDQPQRRARHNLRQALSNLRQAVGDQEDDREPFLLVTRQTVQFNPDSDHWLDVAAFTALSAACKKHRHRRLGNCVPCIRRMTQMADLYGGSLLEQFFLSDSGTFEEWATLQREWLNREVMEALHHLTNYHERRGDYVQAREYAHRQVQLEPWREEAHRQLMRLLALDGQRSAALAQYQTCRRTLAEELNVEPTTETKALVEQIRAEDKLRSKTPPHHLPTSPTPFVGRKEELAELADLLADPDCRLVTLTGPGGIGKTRLALQTAADHIGTFAHGVHYIPLASITSPDFLTSTIISTLGIPPYSTQNPQESLLSYLHNKEMLLVLDNMEHLIDGSLLLTSILQRVPSVMILVTSRERLNLQEEQVYEVGGLVYPEGDITGVESYSAIDLFEQCARRADRHFSIGKGEMPHAVRICQMVEGMPLGVELAAAWVRARSCEEIAREVEHNLDVLTTRLRDVPKRHRSVRATFEYSWQLLAEAERSLLARLSVFHGGFHPQAAARAAGASPTTLSNLLDKSLIRRISSERYDIHNLLRQFAADKLETTPEELAKTQREYTRHFASFLEQQAEHLRGPGQKQALAQIRLEIENARQMWKMAIAQSSDDLIEQSLDSLYYFYMVQCRYQEGIDLFDQAIERWGEGSENKVVFGKALSRQGALLRRWGHYDQAQTALERSLKVFERLENYTEQIFCLVNLADVNRGQGRPEEAEQLAQRGLALSRQTRDSWGITRSLTLLGLVRYRAGDVDRAEALLEESLTLARASGSQRLIMLPLNTLGDVACHRGDYAKARIVFEECLTLSRELEDLFNVAIHLNNLGTVLHTCEAYEEAKGTYQESLEICQEIGDQRGQAIALSNLGEVAFALGAHREAMAYYQRALSIGRDVNDHWTILACLNNLGETACALENYEEANACFTQALKIASETQTLVILLKTMVNLAILYAKKGQTDRAAVLLALARHHPACEQSDHEKAKRLLEEMDFALPDGTPRPLDDAITEILEETHDDGSETQS
jgi:predicted ATPase/DNA-binding SARP family transcriptional activator/Tfp pilus assembly protein PilF